MLGYGLLFSGAAIYLLPFMRLVLSAPDEGTMLVGAERIVHGQVFARDFFEVIGPGIFYLLAAWFKVFGISFLAARAYLFVDLLATAIIIYFLSRRFCPDLEFLPCTVLAGTYFGLFSIGVSHHFDGNLYALLALVCLILWQSNRKAIFLAMSGALLAIATCIMQPKGILLVVAFSLWLIVRERELRKWALPLTLIIGSYVLVIGIVLAYFWRQGALGSLIYANCIFPNRDYGSANSVSYGYGLLGVNWKVWAGVFGQSVFGKTISALLILPEILLALIPFLTPILGVKFKLALDRPESLLLWLSGYALWFSEIHRTDIIHLTYGSPILIVLFAHFLERYKSLVARGVTALIYFSAGALAFWSFIAVTVGAKPIVTRAGTVTSIDRTAPHVLGYLDESVKARDEIFVYPYSPIYYFLSRTVNPTRFSILMYGYNTPEQFREVTEILDERKVQYVVWDTNFVGKEEKEGFPRALQPRPDQLIVEPYLRAHYRRVADYSGVWVMERVEK